MRSGAIYDCLMGGFLTWPFASLKFGKKWFFQLRVVYSSLELCIGVARTVRAAAGSPEFSKVSLRNTLRIPPILTGK